MSSRHYRLTGERYLSQRNGLEYEVLESRKIKIVNGLIFTRSPITVIYHRRPCLNSLMEYVLDTRTLTKKIVIKS